MTQVRSGHRLAPTDPWLTCTTPSMWLTSTSAAIRNRCGVRVAHEPRTPLTTLAGRGETLAHHFDVMSRSDIEDALAAMARQGDRAKVLIDNLLDLSNIEGGRLDFDVASVGLRELIEHVIEAARLPAASALTVTVPRDITVLADPARLKQLINDLLASSAVGDRRGRRRDCHAPRSSCEFGRRRSAQRMIVVREHGPPFPRAPPAGTQLRSGGPRVRPQPPPVPT